MSVYADASVLISFFTEDVFTNRADAFFATRPAVVLSDFAAAEFASARELTPDEARKVFSVFDR